MTIERPETAPQWHAHLRERVVGDLDASSVVVYALRRRRLIPIVAVHRDPERDERFEAVASLTPGHTLASADLAATVGRTRRRHRDRYTAPLSAIHDEPDPWLFDHLDSRVGLPLVRDDSVVGVFVVAGTAEVVDAIDDVAAVVDLDALSDLVADGAPSVGGPPLDSVKLATSLAGAATRDDVTSRVLDVGIDILDADAGSVILMTRPGVYEIVQGRDIGERVLEEWGEFADAAGQDPFSDAITDDRSKFFDSVDSLTEHYPHLWNDVATSGHASWAVVPFPSQESDPVGALGVVWSTPQEFDRDQRICIRSVGHLAATAAVRVESRRSADLTLASMTEQLLGMKDIASDVENVRTSGYYRPAGQHSIAGGDWFDIIDDHTNPGRTYVVLGDVADHGPAAVGTMAAVRAWIRSAVHQTFDPCDIANKVSDLIAAYRYPITTIVIALFDPDERRVTWCSAGHPPPLFADLDAVDFDHAPHGPPLGTVKTADYAQTVRPTEKPLTIVLYSDGLLQRYNSDIDVGFADLRSTVQRLDIHSFSADQLIHRLSVPEAMSDDDVAVLIVHYDTDFSDADADTDADTT